MTLDELLTWLPRVRRSGKQYMACCPAHDDRSPSLSIAEGDDGRLLLYCHAGCPIDAIVAALGLELRDLFVPRPRRRRG